ncbi:hypothetical protein ES705_48848 [subsurface metagenome]
MGRSVPGAKAPVASQETCGPPPGADARPGACLGAPPLYTSLCSSPPRRTPRSWGAYPKSRGGTPGHSPSFAPTTGSTGHPDVFPASPRPVQGRLSRPSRPPWDPPSGAGTRAHYGGRGRLRFRGAYPPGPPECPPRSHVKGALRAPTTNEGAPHEGRGELPPITVLAPSRRKPRSVQRRQRGPSPTHAREARSPANAIAPGLARARVCTARTGACTRTWGQPRLAVPLSRSCSSTAVQHGPQGPAGSPAPHACTSVRGRQIAPDLAYLGLSWVTRMK